MKKKEVKLTKEEEAILYLAEILQVNPLTGDKVYSTVLDILGLGIKK